MIKQTDRDGAWQQRSHIIIKFIHHRWQLIPLIITRGNFCAAVYYYWKFGEFDLHVGEFLI